ncbi:MAG: protein meaA [Deltaproteobacteria bacterium]|nr:protein meaA [Deltaproteobacteria bacterium]
MKKESPWVMRTYSGHSTAKASNELYRLNLSKGQTGLSVAFDLPTQTGYDSDEAVARGEVGKVGVPVSHIGDMETLFTGIPLSKMNTSMTINGTAAWLLALYIAAAERQGVDPKVLQGTTQNDIVKEYLSRGTYIFPPAPSLRLTSDTITYTVTQVPKWNPINVCSYHLQEAGATPVQEVAYTLCTAIAVLDTVRTTGNLSDAQFIDAVGRISFFVNAGLRFIEEICKLRAFGQLWDELTRDRYGITDPKLRRFRYGVQVNSLGLTEAQPENNVPRIVLEALGVTLSKNARCRALQLPTWNEALGLPRPWDQQWSLRIQQILAYETDILEYEDIFEGSKVIEAKTAEIKRAAWTEVERVLDFGGVIPALNYVKEQLVASLTERQRRINGGEQIVVGVNQFTETAQSPLYNGESSSILKVDEEAERDQLARLHAFRAARNHATVTEALSALREAAVTGTNIMPVSIRCAHAGVTTGEWARTLRGVFGEFRAPTGIGGAVVTRAANGIGDSAERLEQLRGRVRKSADTLGRPLKVLIGKPGLDGHSNGAEQIAVWCRDAGMEVVYEGIRLTPEQIVASARDEGVHLIGLSILSGSHLRLVPEIIAGLKAEGLGEVPIVVGGIIPEDDARELRAAGVARVYTPKDFEMMKILSDMVDVAQAAHA